MILGLMANVPSIIAIYVSIHLVHQKHTPLIAILTHLFSLGINLKFKFRLNLKKVVLA